MNIWLKDPITQVPSVSLTLLVATFVLTVIAGGLQMSGCVQSTSLFAEMFYSAVALYFGRRLNIGGKAYTSDKAEEVKKEVTNGKIDKEVD